MRWLLIVAALLLAQLAPAHAQFTQQTSLSQAGTTNNLYASTPQHNFTGNGVAVYVTMTGTGTCTVQISPDPITVWPPPPALQLADWNNHDVLVSITSSAQSSIAYPFSAIRLVCNPLSGTAVLSLVGF